MRLLFEVWGNYQNWKEVIYSYKEEKLTSKTTLPLLLKKENIDKYFIIVSDTLIENLSDNSVNELTYKNMIKEMVKSLNNFIKESKVDSQADIIVSPGIGTFEKTQFIGSPQNFYANLYHILVRKVLQILNSVNKDGEIEIILDITHGINYMTLMAYRAIKDICEILAYFYSVKLRVLNSDPKIGSENVELFINEIEKINVCPRFNFYFYNKSRLIKPSPIKSISDEEKREINEKLNRNEWQKRDEIFLKASNFAGSFLNGLIIFLIRYFQDPDEINKLLERAYELNIENICLTKSYSKLVITQKTELLNTFISLNQIFFLSTLIVKNYNFYNQEEITFSTLKKLKGLFKTNRTIFQRVEKELGKIENNIDKISNTFIDYGSFASDDYDPNIKSGFDERNFFAHCGFGYNIIQLKKEGDEILIKVKEDFINHIEKYIKSNLPKGD